MRKLLAIIFFTHSYVLLQAQAPTVEWQKTFGGSDYDFCYSIKQTTDGGYIMAGYTQSVDGDISGNHSAGTFYGDCWVIKLDNTGALQWQRCLGGTGQESINSVVQTIDGEFIVVGYTQSKDGNVTGIHSNSDDAWVVKLDADGNIIWQKTLGGAISEEARSIKQTTDGGYIIAAEANSEDGDVSGHHGGGDFWVIKLDNEEDIEWQKCYGGTDVEVAYDIQPTQDGGYIVGGVSGSDDGEVSVNRGYMDGWVIKLDVSGNIEWKRSLGGSDYDYLYSVQQAVDGSYIVAGYTQSNDGDVSGNHGASDFWIVKLSSAGAIVWQKCLGGSASDVASKVMPTADGGYMIAGSSASNDGDFADGQSNVNGWIVKLDNAGSIQWKKSLGGSGNDYLGSIQQTADGSYVASGYTESNDGDISGNHGAADFWIVKFGALTLPVTWGHISVVNIEKVNNLTWNTLTESNTSHFEIERSADGTQFTKTGRHAAAGNSNSSINYAFEDINPIIGKNYYRVKQVDIDGNFKYSKIVSVLVTEASGRMKLYPNPVSTQLTINVPIISGKYTVRVVDALGRLCKLSTVPGNRSITLPMQDIADGVYHITLRDGAKIYTGKFIKNSK